MSLRHLLLPLLAAAPLLAACGGPQTVRADLHFQDKTRFTEAARCDIEAAGWQLRFASFERDGHGFATLLPAPASGHIVLQADGTEETHLWNDGVHLVGEPHATSLITLRSAWRSDWLVIDRGWQATTESWPAITLTYDGSPDLALTTPVVTEARCEQLTLAGEGTSEEAIATWWDTPIEASSWRWLDAGADLVASDGTVQGRLVRGASGPVIGRTDAFEDVLLEVEGAHARARVPVLDEELAGLFGVGGLGVGHQDTAVLDPRTCPYALPLYVTGDASEEVKVGWLEAETVFGLGNETTGWVPVDVRAPWVSFTRTVWTHAYLAESCPPAPALGVLGPISEETLETLQRDLDAAPQLNDEAPE